MALEVEEISLDISLPSTWLKMVAMQPHIHLTDTEPFRWPDDKKAEQIDGIKRTLEVAKDKRAHFSIFPEYSIPGLDGVSVIDKVIANNDWPNDFIVIGGIDGLKEDEYQQLCQQPNIKYHPKNSPNNLAQTEWVNCSVTWAKDNHDNIKKYIQLKICPSWPEKNIRLNDMFSGKVIYVFNAKYENNFPCRFVSFICFDWIGKINNSEVALIDKFLNVYNKKCGDNPNHLHWIFVLQENDEPNHDLFIRRTSDFLTIRNDNPMVERVNSAIVFVNNSGKTWRNDTDSNRAFTSCVFPETDSLDTTGCPHTISFASGAIRGKTISRCKDTLFREQSPCIHSFNIRVTQFLNLTQESRCHPIEKAFVHPLDERCEDPRFPDGPVPACVKWVNDRLDNIQHLGAEYPQALPNETHESHEVILEGITKLPANRQQDNIHYATASHSDNNLDDWTDADLWDTQEIDSLKHLLHTITICRIADNGIDLENSVLHARITIDGKLYEIVAINGHKHEEDCTRHFNNVCKIKINHLVRIISRDVDNNPFVKRLSQKITKQDTSGEVAETKFADPEYSIVQRGYRELLDIYRNSNNQEELVQGLIRYVT